MGDPNSNDRKVWADFEQKCRCSGTNDSPRLLIGPKGFLTVKLMEAVDGMMMDERSSGKWRYIP